MEQKNNNYQENLNYTIENENFFLGERLNKLSTIIIVFILTLSFGLVLIPLLFFTNFIVAISVFSTINIINIVCGIRFSNSGYSIYQTIYLWLKFKNDVKKIEPNKIINNNLIYIDNNTVILSYENKFVIKSFFEISSNVWNEKSLNESIHSFLRILDTKEQIRIYSLKSNFDVESNIEKIYSLIDKNINFQNNDILKDDKSKLLLQQFAEFISLKENNDINNINVIEIQKEITQSNIEEIKNIKSSFWKNEINNFKIYENSFFQNANSSNSIKLTYPSLNKMDIILKKLAFDDDIHSWNFNGNNIAINKDKFYRFIKLSKLPPILESGFLFELLNNNWNYEVNITYHSLNENDEAKIINEFERNNNSNLFVKKRNFRKSNRIRRELNEQILEDKILEIESQDIRSKGISVVIKIEGNSKEELAKNLKEFRTYFKIKRILFESLLFLQKKAFLDFYIGLENKFKKNGKERKNKFNKKKLNNINNYSLWQTSNSASFSLPIKSKIDLEPGGWVLGDDIYNNPVAIDFELNRPNHHMAIIGQSGSGKTTAAEYLIRQKLIKKDERESLIFIIDPKGEWEDIVEQNNGQIINLSNGFINPFLRKTKEITNDEKDFIKEFLRTFLIPLKLNIESLVLQISNLIFNSKAWKENKVNFDEILKLIKNDKEFKNKYLAIDFEKILDFIKNYSKEGEDSYLFNSNIDIDIKKQIISFNFSKLITSSNSFETSALVFSIISFLNKIMFKNDPKFKEKHKYDITIIIDEFHLLVNAENNLIIKRFDSLYAISRSFGVGIISIFQNLQILNNPKVQHHSKSIFSNTSYFLAFSQQKQQLEALLDLLPENIEVSESEKERLLSNVKHESLIIYGNNKKFTKWKLGLFYNEKRDEDVDGLKRMRMNEYKELENVCKEYIEIKKGEQNE